MNVHGLAASLSKKVIDNSPGILAGLATVGVLGTAYLASKATLKASRVIDEEEETGGRAEPGWPVIRERTRLVWKYYIPAASTGALTIACIIGSNRIGNRRAAAIAAAYSLSEKVWTEYKENVVKELGTAKEEKVRERTNASFMAKNPSDPATIVITGSGDVLCYEVFTGRYFKSSRDALVHAMNDTNQMVINNNYASLGDFYNFAGLPSTGQSEEVGWNLDKLMELEFTGHIGQDGEPCLAFTFQAQPIRDYYRLR